MFKKPIVFDKYTRTAKEAAESLGCEVSQIAKSLIFIDSENKPVLVITSGSNRVNETKFGVKKADADYVKKVTGFVIGGVPPWGHKEKIRSIVDSDLKSYNRIWASAGKTNAVFETTFEELVKETQGEIMDVD